MDKLIKNAYFGLTGKFQMYYTLYVESIFVTENYSYTHIDYIRNVSKDTVKTEKIVNDLKQKKSFNNVIFEVDTPLKWSGKHHFEAFNLCWSLSKNKKHFYACPDCAFWDLWKVNKEGMKAKGFWVMKTYENEWLVFKKSEITMESDSE